MDTKRSAAPTSALWITAVVVGSLSLVCAQRGLAAVTTANAMATTRTVGPLSDSSPISLPVSKQPIIISAGQLTLSDGVHGNGFTHVNYLPTPIKELQFNGQDRNGNAQAGDTNSIDIDFLEFGFILTLRTAALNNANAAIKVHNDTGETHTATILMVW